MKFSDKLDKAINPFRMLGNSELLLEGDIVKWIKPLDKKDLSHTDLSHTLPRHSWEGVPVRTFLERVESANMNASVWRRK